LAYPVASFTTNATGTMLGLKLMFNDTSTGGDRSVQFKYQWNFGDGSSNQTTQNCTYLYAAVGSYVVTLTVNDSEYDIAVFSTTVTVYAYPVANFTSSATDIAKGQTLRLYDNSSGGYLPMLYQWSFGDGSANATTYNPTHQYASVGTYTVTLTITDSCPFLVHTSVATMSITVVPNVLPSASFSMNVTSVVAGDWVHFTDKTTGGNAPYTYEWNFGDGTGNYTTQNVDHQFTAAGTYTVTLTVTDSVGGVSVYSTTVTVAAATTTTGNNDTIYVAIAIIAAAAMIMVGILAKKRSGRATQAKVVAKAKPAPTPIVSPAPAPKAAPVPAPKAAPVPAPKAAPAPTAKGHVKVAPGKPAKGVTAPEVPPPEVAGESAGAAAAVEVTQGEREQQMKKVLLDERKKYLVQIKDLEKSEMWAKLERISLHLEQISDQLYKMGDPAEAQNVKLYRRQGQKYHEKAQEMQQKAAEKEEIKAKYKPKKNGDADKRTKKMSDV
jgi:PKD repeat protein